MEERSGVLTVYKYSLTQRAMASGATRIFFEEVVRRSINPQVDKVEGLVVLFNILFCSYLKIVTSLLF